MKKSSLLKSKNKNNFNHDDIYKTNYSINITLNENNENNKLILEENDLLEEFEIIKVMRNRFSVAKISRKFC